MSASASFTVAPGTLSITLTNLLANQTSVGQALSDLQFQLSPNAGTSATLSSSTSQEISIDSNQQAMVGATVSTGWALQSYAGGWILCVICPANGTPPPTTNPPPSHLILGSGPYTNANGSIAGNPAHNPYLNQSATFTISGQAFDATTLITSVIFSFGTQFGVDITGEEESGGGGGSGSEVPEPATWALLPAGAIGVIALRRRRQLN